MTLMPGVADPNYQQSGGINNPGRTMSLTVNGQPSTNTVVRLDGITAANQFFENIQSYGPSLEAIETVNVVTSSFDADQGMAGAAAVNVQVKSGTNDFRGSAFKYVTDARMRARNYFLPADQDQGTSRVHVFGGTLGGPILKNKLFFFFSDETTSQRTFAGNAQGQTGTNGFMSMPPDDLRRGDFSNSATPIYDPLTGNPTTGAKRMPFAFANCLGSPRRPIPASTRAITFRPTGSIRSRPRCSRSSCSRRRADTRTTTSRHRLRHELSQDRRQDDLQPGSEAEPERAMGFLPSWEAFARHPPRPSTDGRSTRSRKDACGTRSSTATRWRDDHPFAELRGRRLVRVHEAQRPRVSARGTCYGELRHSNACQPPTLSTPTCPICS